MTKEEILKERKRRELKARQWNKARKEREETKRKS